MRRAQVNLTAVEAQVAALAQCLINPSVGLSCPLAETLLTPGYTVDASGIYDYSGYHYISVLAYDLRDPQASQHNMSLCV